MGDIKIEKSPLEINRDKIKRKFLNPLICDFMESYIYQEDPRYSRMGHFRETMRG